MYYYKGEMDGLLVRLKNEWIPRYEEYYKNKASNSVYQEIMNQPRFIENVNQPSDITDENTGVKYARDNLSKISELISKLQ